MDKKLMYGTFSAVSILIVIAVLIFVNLIFEKINIQTDLTKEGLYTITDDSKEALGKISEDVNIYVIAETGQEDERVRELLDEYTKNSSKISVQYINPYTNPEFVKGFSENGEEIENGSIIVKNDKKFKVIKPMELYERQANYYTNTYTVTGISAESEITNAINFVSMGETPVIYYVVGHNEKGISQTLKSAFEKINYEVKDLNITKEKGIPDDCRMLFITTPLNDYSKNEADSVINYLLKDGRAMVFLDRTENTPNLDSILSAYGVKMGNETVFEGNSDYYTNYPTWLMPEVQSGNEITEIIVKSGYPVMVMEAQGIESLELKKESVIIEPLLKTTESSYGKSSKEYKTVNFEQGDKTGPFNIAVAITDSYYTDTNHLSKIIVCGSSSIITEELIREVPTSLMFVVYSANWLKDGEDTTIYIPPKSLEPDLIAVPDGTKRNITIFVCAVIPAVIFIFGIVVWYRRKYS